MWCAGCRDDRASEGRVAVVDAWDFEAPRPRDAVAALEALNVEGRVLLVADRGDVNTWKSFANLGHVHVISPGELNAYDVLVCDWVVFTQATLPGGSASTGSSAPVDSEPATDEEEEE